MKIIAGSTLLLTFALLTGCGYDGPVPDPPQAKPAVPTAQTTPDAKAVAQSKTPDKPSPEVTGQEKPTAQAGNPSGEGGTRKLIPRSEFADTAAPAPGTVREKAAVGMGEKGRGYGGNNMVTMPVKALWAAKELLVLDQIQHALNIYKALDPNGRGPQSHQEFMDRIVKENSISLPTLPEGQHYIYDPVEGLLTVERPDH